MSFSVDASIESKMQWFDAMALATNRALKTLPAKHVMALHRESLEVFSQHYTQEGRSTSPVGEPAFEVAQPPHIDAAPGKMAWWQRSNDTLLHPVLTERAPRVDDKNQ